MAAKKKNASKPTVPAEPAPKVAELWVKSTGSKDHGVSTARISEIVSSIWLHEGISEKERNNRILAAVQMFSEIKPQNGVEGMLATEVARFV